MKRPRMRPVFAVALEDPASFWEALKATLRDDAGPCVGTTFRKHAVIRMADEHQHFWSPHLYLELRDAEDGPGATGALLHGRFAPHPNVWTMFMALYGLIILAGTAAFVWGVSVWTLGEAPWVLLGVPAAAALYAFVFGAAFIGQGLGASQMYEQRAVLDRALRRCELEVVARASTLR